MRQQTEYLAAAALVAYIVFLTRPAPTAIVQALSSPIAQLIALGLVAYVGANFSLIVALLMGLAFVLSTPTREYADDESIKPKKKASEKTDDKKTAEKADEKKPAPPKAPITTPGKPVTKAAAPAPKPAAKPAPKPGAPKPAPEDVDGEPLAAGQKIGKETFISGIAANAAVF